jgi:alpha-soluble NSF attachment protein
VLPEQDYSHLDLNPKSTKKQPTNSRILVSILLLLSVHSKSHEISPPANAYRTVRNLKKSGQAFERAADIHQNQLSDPQEAAKMLQDAYKSYKDESPSDAIRCLDRSIQLYTAKGNFRRAADMMCDLADTYEVKLEDFSKALQCLETAITWYTDENIPATANKYRQKAGQLAAVMGDYYKAVSLFVACAEAAASIGQTARFSIKTYLFKAGSK